MILTGPSTELRPLHPGTADADIVVLDSPLSFWGGVDRRTGAVIDVHHPQCGLVLAGRVVALPSGRGSSSSSSVLAEVLRYGAGPAALLLREPDLIISLGVIVAAELYQHFCPVVVLSAAAYEQLRDGDHAHLEATAGDVPVTAVRAHLETTPTGARSGRAMDPEGAIP